ncbi:MAG: sigma-54 dependent transcriptional regulator [Thermoanaerobaculia bacterium]|nr:sigma-54 dependent transcriptional regulator [Thermoanaerobaculia bacterium]
MTAEAQILVIDDDTSSREAMAIAIEKTGWKVARFDDARRALEFLADGAAPDLAICDLRMPGLDGLGFLQAVRQRGYDLSVLLVTAFGTIESAVEAMRVGADDYLTKPLDLYELRKKVTTQLERRQLAAKVAELTQQLDKRYGFESIIGRAPAMEALFEQMRLVAPTRSNVLIIGESGTGKELVANAIHRASPRRDERFLAINCGAIPPDILESELFGHEKGSFTGAIGRKIGKFELAHRGTLFLDEISELYPELQVKLLRVLEDRRVMRVGGADLIEVDFRLIAATNKDLEREVAAGRFREDLYYRLKVVTLRIPPLRERPGDIPLLAEHYLKMFCKEHGREAKRLSPRALEALQAFAWPGNVRELKNAMESIVVFHRGPEVAARDLPVEIRQAVGVEEEPARDDAGAAERPAVELPASGELTMADIERQAIVAALERTGGRRAEAAKLLDIGLRTLQRKLKEYKQQGLFGG